MENHDRLNIPQGVAENSEGRHVSKSSQHSADRKSAESPVGEDEDKHSENQVVPSAVPMFQPKQHQNEKRKFRNFNPCYCCLYCNGLLRDGCILISAVFVVRFFIFLFWLGFQFLTCVQSPECEPQSAILLVQLLQIIVLGLAGFLLFYSASKRWAPGALVSTALILLYASLYLTTSILLKVFSTPIESSPFEVLYFIYFGLWMLSMPYFAICAFALYRQIKANVDLIHPWKDRPPDENEPEVEATPRY